MEKKPNFYSTAGLIAGATLLSRILGLVREQVFAYFFGAGLYTDAFQIAFRIPNLLRNLFAEGAMSSALVPVYTKLRLQKGDGVSWRLVCNIATSLILILGAVSVLGILFADPLVRLYAPGFSETPGKHELTVRLTQVLWPFLPLVMLASVWMGVLNSRDRYGIPAIAPTIFNLASILAAFFLCPYMEPWLGIHPIYGMAFGAVLGGLGQWLLQVPSLRREGFRYFPYVNWGDSDLRRVFILMGGGTFALAATQINILVNSILATGEGNGAVSWLNYAFRLMQFPIGVFGVAISTVTLTKVSREVATHDLESVRRSVVEALRMVIVLTIPSAVGLAFFGVPIISVIYEHGLFTAGDTAATAGALACYALGLTAYSGIKVLVPIFYSFGRSRPAVIASAFSMALNLTLCVLFVRWWGFRGLALAASIASLVNCGILLTLLERLIKNIEFTSLIRCVLQTVFCSAVMAFLLCVILYALQIPLWGSVSTESIWLHLNLTARATILFSSLTTAVVCFWCCAKVIGLNEVNRISQLISEQIWKLKGQ